VGWKPLVMEVTKSDPTAYSLTHDNTPSCIRRERLAPAITQAVDWRSRGKYLVCKSTLKTHYEFITPAVSAPRGTAVSLARGLTIVMLSIRKRLLSFIAPDLHW